MTYNMKLFLNGKISVCCKTLSEGFSLAEMLREYEEIKPYYKNYDLRQFIVETMKIAGKNEICYYVKNDTLEWNNKKDLLIKETEVVNFSDFIKIEKPPKKSKCRKCQYFVDGICDKNKGLMLFNVVGCGNFKKKEKINEIEKHPTEPWRPDEKNPRYYWVGAANEINSLQWAGGVVDYMFFNSGNCFRTAEEITPEVKKRIFQEMKGKYQKRIKKPM